MRLIKAQNTNIRSISGKGVKYDIYDIVQMDSERAVVVPKGDVAARPDFPTDGMLRYNTVADEFEVYANGAWSQLKRKAPGSITQQNLGNGDASEVYFGPLDSGDSDFPVPQTARNILVFVENVFQISGTNYSLRQNPPGKVAGWYVEFTSAPDLGKPVTVLHNFDK